MNEAQLFAISCAMGAPGVLRSLADDLEDEMTTAKRKPAAKKAATRKAPVRTLEADFYREPILTTSGTYAGYPTVSGSFAPCAEEKPHQRYEVRVSGSGWVVLFDGRTVRNGGYASRRAMLKRAQRAIANHDRQRLVPTQITIK